MYSFGFKLPSKEGKTNAATQVSVALDQTAQTTADGRKSWADAGVTFAVSHTCTGVRFDSYKKFGESFAPKLGNGLCTSPLGSSDVPCYGTSWNGKPGTVAVAKPTGIHRTQCLLDRGPIAGHPPAICGCFGQVPL